MLFDNQYILTNNICWIDTTTNLASHFISTRSVPRSFQPRKSNAISSSRAFCHDNCYLKTNNCMK